MQYKIPNPCNSVVGSGVNWVHSAHQTLIGLLYLPQVIVYEDVEFDGVMIGKRNWKSSPVPLCPPQIPHDLTGHEPGPLLLWEYTKWHPRNIVMKCKNEMKVVVMAFTSILYHKDKKYYFVGVWELNYFYKQAEVPILPSYYHNTHIQ
jgi:hypothetical protein